MNVVRVKKLRDSGMGASAIAKQMGIGRTNERQCFRIGIVSLLLCLGIAIAGRMIAFVHG